MGATATKHLGAMKAGTVSLRHYLAEHRDVVIWRGEKAGPG
jgi:hypothetical protein